jgi:hypothetical protein
LKFPERLADVAGDGRFLGDDKGLAHVARSSLRRETPFAQLNFFKTRNIPCRGNACFKLPGATAVTPFRLKFQLRAVRRGRGK